MGTLLRSGQSYSRRGKCQPRQLQQL